MLGKMYPIKCERNIFHLKFKHTGMGGYSITAKGAKYLLNKIKNRNQFEKNSKKISIFYFIYKFTTVPTLIFNNLLFFY